MIKNGLTSTVIGATFLIVSGCSDSDTTSSASLDAYPSGLAISSPTASDSGSSIRLASLDNRFVTSVPSETYSAKKADYETVLAAATDEACQVALGSLLPAGEPSCYGPRLDYQGHPDGAGPTSGGQLPPYDLGIWTATESTGEACVAAKINSQMETIAAKVDYVLFQAAAMVCLMTRAGTSLPAASGDGVTLTTELNTALQVNNVDTTITGATLERKDDITDTSGTARSVYQYTILSTVKVDGDDVDVTAYMRHMPTNDDNSKYQGRVWAQFDGINGGLFHAYSVTYEKASDTELSYQLRYADYDTSTDPFDANDELALDSGWGSNMSQAVAAFDPETEDGHFNYAWQAGANDSHSRVFNGFTSGSNGCGFFGYGDKFDGLTTDYPSNEITKFICNWAGPSGSISDNTTSEQADNAQKQCMTKNSDGLWEVDSTKNNISYAPTNSCTSDTSFGYKLATESLYSTTPITNDLIDLTTDADFTDYSAPDAPDLPEGL